VVDNAGQSRIYIPARESVFTPANHPGFRPRTRVINGSGPNPRYRGTKLRANLPQPYINPDFLTLLSQRGPSSSSSSSSSSPPPPHSAFLLMPDSPRGTMQRTAQHASPCLDYSLAGIRPNCIKIRAPVTALPPRSSSRGNYASDVARSDPSLPSGSVDLYGGPYVSPNRERNGSSPGTGCPRALRPTSRDLN
jgi:hypothetical protein